MKSSALVLLMLMAHPVSAQSLTSISYGVFVGGQFADLASTKSALNQGLTEANPTLRGSFSQIVVKKSLLSAGTLLGAWYLQRHAHPTLANAIRFMGGGVGLAAAIHNYRVMR